MASRRFILRKLPDLDVAVVYFPAFRLQADIALRRLRVEAFVHQFAVQANGHLAILAGDLIPVPFAEQRAVANDDAALRAFDGGSLNAEKAARLAEVALDFETL